MNLFITIVTMVSSMLGSATASHVVPRVAEHPKMDERLNVNLITRLRDKLNPPNLDEIRKLVERGASANAKSEKGKSALLLAAHAGVLDVCVYLVEQGAETSCAGEDIIYGLLRYSHRPEVVSEILKACTFLVNKGAEVSDAPLKMVTEIGNQQVVKFVLRALLYRSIIKEGKDTRNSLKMRAARVKTLLLASKRPACVAIKNLVLQILLSTRETERDLLSVLLSAHWHRTAIPEPYVTVLKIRLPIAEKVTIFWIKRSMHLARLATSSEELQALLDPANFQENFLKF